MHGASKMLTEGFRTRDAHLIEWFAKLGVNVEVLSRPDPFPLPQLARRRRTEFLPAGVAARETSVFRVPPLRDRKRWWVQSADHYPTPTGDGPLVVWSPVVFLSSRITRHITTTKPAVHFDLLDDWTVHHAFTTIHPELEEAYSVGFQLATSVSANSEGTAALAARFNRGDVDLLPNGVDPQRFALKPTASGPITVGYFGKIGRRLDASLIKRTVIALPDIQFVFAGQVLEKETVRLIGSHPNLHFVGDVPYRDAARTLASFDIGWVPHGVDEGQVGGDAIKIYEYRAAGLPVITTPIIGVRERPLEGVIVSANAHETQIRALATGGGGRVPRQPMVIPATNTWKHKAEFILQRLR